MAYGDVCVPVMTIDIGLYAYVAADQLWNAVPIN